MTKGKVGKKRKITPAQIELMREYRRAGLSFAKIGKKFDVTAPTVMYNLNTEYYKALKRSYYGKVKQRIERKKKQQLTEQKGKDRLKWAKDLLWGGDKK